MKKYMKPAMESEVFIANEYVGACYKIRCTTPNNNGTYYYLYDDTNNNRTFDKEDKLLYSSWFGFKGCNKWHKGVIRNEAPEANGFVTEDEKGTGAAPVHWWREDLGSSTNYHAMVPGSQNYETNRNAS